ncbi:hypothetical protein [Rodentibacter abscessus]|uniref:hypothetical protein n=1 Tax=Rodentibacter abscessus TaxID=3381777 RepID=UPI00399C63AD
MKLKTLLISALIGLSLAACNDEVKDFSGSYKIKLGEIQVTKMPSGKYETVYINPLKKGREITKIAEIKDGNRLYETNGNYLGEFTDTGLKTAGGTFYEKVLSK